MLRDREVRHTRSRAGGAQPRAASDVNAAITRRDVPEERIRDRHPA
jgi:hypothetical protein